MTAFDDKITAGFGYWRNGAQGSSCTAAILSRECLLWVRSGHAALKFRCPLYPRKRTLPGECPLSAISIQGPHITGTFYYLLLFLNCPLRQLV